MTRGRVARHVPAAHEAGRLCAEQQARGASIEIRDVQIVGIARACRASLATGNTRNLTSLCDVVDPWDR